MDQEAMDVARRWLVNSLGENGIHAELSADEGDVVIVEDSNGEQFALTVEPL